MRRLRVLLGLSMLTMLAGGSVGVASAAPPPSSLKVSFTDSCENPSICGSVLGGEWGQGTFKVGSTGEVEVTFESHLQGGPFPGGTQHLKTHILSWEVGAGFNGVPNILFDDYFSTFVGHGPPTDSAECFLGCPLFTEIPAVPGHYDLQSFFGITPAPGFSFSATVIAIH
jgi:hypothetical protein